MTKRVSEAKKKKITGMSVPGTGQSEAQQTRQHGDVNTVPVGGSRQISKPAETSMSAGLNSTEVSLFCLCVLILLTKTTENL